MDGKKLDISNKRQQDNSKDSKGTLNQGVMSPHDQNIVREKKKH
jgi:hypothetical protein